MFSTIKRKTCKCGCSKMPTLGYNGYSYGCAPQEIKDKVGTKNKVAKRNRDARTKVTALLRNDDATVKRALLLKADKVFGDFIKKRDSDERGNVTCPGCCLQYNLSEKGNDNANIVQPLHFISRGVYSLRFNEENCHSGCSYCNLQMHLIPDGAVYQNYRTFMVHQFGIIAVLNMEAERRNINKLSAADLQEVIKKYSPK